MPQHQIEGIFVNLTEIHHHSVEEENTKALRFIFDVAVATLLLFALPPPRGSSVEQTPNASKHERSATNDGQAFRVHVFTSSIALKEEQRATNDDGGKGCALRARNRQSC